MEIKTALLNNEKLKVKEFLKSMDLEYDEDINYTLYAVEEEKIIATISVSNTIIKAFAISPAFQGESIANILITEMINYFKEKHIYQYFVYTKPKNKRIFESLSFREIITTDEVCLLESITSNIRDYLDHLKEEYQILGKDVGAIVMNCNPFTLGHLYLIETAAKFHEELLVFILEEDKSFFSYQDRFFLVKEGTKELKNVKVLPSSPYLVSSLTFPTYFMKKDVDTVFAQAKLDAMIFEKYFIPIFHIKKRYLGTETDLVTNKYNQALKEVLQDKIEIIERKKVDDITISASLVRAYLKNKEFEKIKPLVPISTYRFLKSKYDDYDDYDNYE